MKFFIAVVVTSILSIALCLYLPWWSIAIAAFAVAVAVPQKPFISFLAGFTALLLTWGLLTFYISNTNGHILAQKVSVIILKANNPIMLMTVTALIGAIVGGLAALSGSFVRKVD